MTRILTVDDSRAIRSMLTKSVKEMGFDVDEAEDGEQGLVRLMEAQYDLVLLDVTMPVLDGPGMLEKMRARGDKTPVLMLTSESKRSTVSTVMQLGIADYILKPFRPDELAAKISKAIGVVAAVPAALAAPLAAPARNHAPDAGGRTAIDILIVDDMENVHKKAKTLLPPHLSSASVLSGRAAVQAARETNFRLILIDLDLEDVTSGALLTQLRSLQPQVACIALTLRSTSVDPRIKSDGFDGVMHKPFTQADFDELMQLYFDNQDLVSRDDNCLRIAKFTGKEERMEKYFERIGDLTIKSLEDIAAACFDETIVDASDLPARPDRVPKLVRALQASTSKLGLELRLVASNEVKKILATFAETNTVLVYATLQEARSS